MSVWACGTGGQSQHVAVVVMEHWVLFWQSLTSRIEVLEGRETIRHVEAICNCNPDW